MTQEVDTNLMDFHCSRGARNGKSHGYRLPNDVYVVWQTGSTQNSTSTLEKTLARFPNLVLLPTRMIGEIMPNTPPQIYVDGKLVA